MVRRNTTQIGQSAEEQVAELLKQQKHKIITKNWKTTGAEVDIISVKKKVAYFTEVKYRQNSEAGDGFEYISASKLKHMIRGAETWVLENNWKGEYLLQAASVVGDHIELREIAF